MPGITGIITKKSPEETESKLQTMIDSMLHEPFYKSGSYTDEKLGIYAGWICHEGSFCDCMPVYNEKKDIALIFFGENFTDLDIFTQIKANHHKLDKADKTNAGYIIHLYEDEGVDFLKNMNGWFCGLLVDTRTGEVILFNDRYGTQRIFYYEGTDAFYFSSEAKALLKICPELRELNPLGFNEYITCGCPLEYRTLFKNVFLLPGSSTWTFRQDGEIQKRKYFDPEIWENQPWLDAEFFQERLLETFNKILPRYFRSEQQIGISLTGGFDTRMILANAEIPEGKYPCYSFGGIYRDCADVTVARKVAEACKQTHETIYLDKQFLMDFQKYAEKTIYISDGYLDAGGSYELYVNNLARGIAPVRMTGNYGGEVIRGIEGQLRARRPNASLFTPELATQYPEIAETVAGLYRSANHPISFNLFYEIPLFRNHGFVIEQSQLTPRSPYLDIDLVSLMYRASPGIRDNKTKKISIRLVSDGNPELGKIPSDRGIGGSLKFPLSGISKLFNEFTFKAEYAYNYGMPQWLAKCDYAFKPFHLEKLFLGRHKFAHFRVWYRDDLSNYIKDVLLDEKTLNRPYLNRGVIEKTVTGHTKGYANYTNELTLLLTIELIQRLFIEGN